MAFKGHIFLLKSQPLATGDPNLLLHDIDAGDQLGNGVLHLNPGVHFNKVELIILEQELDRASAPIADSSAGLGASLAGFVPQLNG